MGIDVISWDTVIDKKVKSSDDQELGKVHTITKDFLQTKEGVVSKNYYFIPKYYVQGYDGENIWISLPKEEAKDKFERENAPEDLKGFLPKGYDERRADMIIRYPEFDTQVPSYSPQESSCSEIEAHK